MQPWFYDFCQELSPIYEYGFVTKWLLFVSLKLVRIQCGTKLLSPLFQFSYSQLQLLRNHFLLFFSKEKIISNQPTINISPPKGVINHMDFASTAPRLIANIDPEKKAIPAKKK